MRSNTSELAIPQILAFEIVVRYRAAGLDRLSELLSFAALKLCILTIETNIALDVIVAQAHYTDSLTKY